MDRAPGKPGGAAGAGTDRRLVPASAVLRAEDALFLHAQTPLLCQQVGALLMLEPADVRLADFRAAMRQRVAAVPELNRRLEPPRGTWRRPRWVADHPLDVTARIHEVSLGDHGPGTVRDVVDRFFSDRSDPYRTPWEMLLVHGAPDRRTAVVVKVHHTVGDSAAIIGALSKLFDAEPAPARLPDAAVPAVPAIPREAVAPGPGASPRRRPSHRRHTRLQAAGRALRGLCHLMAAGRAPAISVCGPFTTDRRRYLPLALPAREVATTARALETGIADLLLIVTAEALSRLLRARGESTAGQAVRIAVPRARRSHYGQGGQASGNRSAAVSLDLPVGPLSLTERLAAIRGQVDMHVRWGEPDAAALILRALNFLPLPVQRRAAARLYQCRWFNMLVSIFPGIRHSYRLLGARVEEVYPVLALADGVGLAIGAMTWGRSLFVGILADAGLVPDADTFAAEFSAAFRSYRDAAGLATGAIPSAGS